MKKIPFQPAATHPLPTNRVRASFILSQSHIKTLKNLIFSARPNIDRVSTFVVATAYVWTTLAKSLGPAGDEDEDEVFFIMADGTGRRNALFDPPVPVNFFGNCLSGGKVIAEHRKLAAEDGFVAAAEPEAIVDEIKKKIYDGAEFLKSQEKILTDMAKYKDTRALIITGSSKFDYAKADFGWGEAQKVEVLSLDAGGYYMMSLFNSRDGDFVVGMSLTKEEMEAFASMIATGLYILLWSRTNKLLPLSLKIYDGNELLKSPEDRLSMSILKRVFAVLVVYGSPKFEYKILFS